MQTKISSKGQVVLPGPIRRKLGLRAGDALKAVVEGDRIVLSRLAPPAPKAHIGVNVRTGLPVLIAGAKAQKLTSRQVAELLAEFPVTYLLDVNALLALGLREHEFQERVSNWVEGLSHEDVLATCPLTELGFVRILSQVPQYNITVEQGRTLLARLKSARARRVTFIADTHGAEQLPGWVKTGRQTTDGHLCALAAAHAASLATLDQNIPGAFVIPEV